MIEAILLTIVVVPLLIWLIYTFSGKPPSAMSVVQNPVSTASGVDEEQAKFMFFHVTWCPHCREAEGYWKSFKQTLKNKPKTYGGKTIVFEEIDCEGDEGKSALYGITAYPTFKLETKGQLFEMMGKPSVQAFDQFLSHALGN